MVRSRLHNTAAQLNWHEISFPFSRAHFCFIPVYPNQWLLLAFLTALFFPAESPYTGCQVKAVSDSWRPNVQWRKKKQDDVHSGHWMNETLAWCSSVSNICKNVFHACHKPHTTLIVSWKVRVITVWRSYAQVQIQQYKYIVRCMINRSHQTGPNDHQIKNKLLTLSFLKAF